MSKCDWITIITIAIMVTSVVVLGQYYYNMNNQKCISNPLVYAATYYEEQYGYPLQGTAYFIIVGGQSPIIVFDSNSFNVTYPGG